MLGNITIFNFKLLTSCSQGFQCSNSNYLIFYMDFVRTAPSSQKSQGLEISLDGDKNAPVGKVAML
jgi:hypothetical protein